MNWEVSSVEIEMLAPTGSNVMDSWHKLNCLSYGKITHLMTLWADKSTFQLTLEQIDNDTVVSLFVTCPACFTQLGEFSITSSRLPIWLFDVRLLLNTVQIFMQAVKQESDEFLSIVLSVSGELRSEVAGPLLQDTWRVRCVGSSRSPEILNSQPERTRNLAIHAERIVRV